MTLIKYFIRIFLLVLLALLIYFLYLLAPTSFSDEKIRFVVPLEADQEKVVEQLHQERFIRSKKLFQFLAGFMKFPGSIEPGSYLLYRRMTAIGIARTLLFNPYQKWVILVPGLRKEQVAEKLAEKFGWSIDKTNEFLGVAKEGYLFPDTYLLNIEYTGVEFAQRLMSNFEEHLDEQMQKDLLAQNVKVDTAVKIASLIERESGSDEDKPLIAGIIWNRLNTGMKLQIDATSQYIKGGKGIWWPHITPADHKLESPYNTYIYKGLPPGPIANPSLASLKAVIYSIETDCFYYLHDRNKTIHCAKTYQEHLDNIDTYLR